LGSARSTPKSTRVGTTSGASRSAGSSTSSRATATRAPTSSGPSSRHCGGGGDRAPAVVTRQRRRNRPGRRLTRPSISPESYVEVRDVLMRRRPDAPKIVHRTRKD
jgi:hypothetical protein